MHWIPEAQATTLTHDLSVRPDAAGTFRVLDAGGTVVQGSTAATLDSVDTTLNGALPVSSGAALLTSVTGVVVGREYLLGGSEDTGGESVEVVAVNGSSIAFAARTMAARATGTAFQSPRVSFAISAIAAGKDARRHWVEYTYVVGGVTQPPLNVPFLLARFYPTSTLNLNKLRAYDGLYARRIPDGAWHPRIKAEAWQRVLRLVAVHGPVGGVYGAIELTAAHAYQVLALIHGANATSTEERAFVEALEKRVVTEIDHALGPVGVDRDEDGVIEAEDEFPGGQVIPLG